MAPAAAPLIAFVGPTAAGKSAAALRLASERGGEIVSCDSLQVYRGLDIGSAKPSAEERARVRHHLIDVVEPTADFSAAEYARQAREALAAIRERGSLSIVVGGTGLYLRALLQGLFEGPSRDEPLRRRLEAWAKRFGDRRLHRLLTHVDKAAASRIHPNDRLRIVRALEVFRATRRPISTHHEAGSQALPGFAPHVIGIDPGAPALRVAVVARTRRMLSEGLLSEVRGLLARGLSPECRPLRAIGYRQAVKAVLEDRKGDEIERDIVTATMQYAKRQRTWFRHQVQAAWCRDAEAAHAAACSWLDRGDA